MKKKTKNLKKVSKKNLKKIKGGYYGYGIDGKWEGDKGPWYFKKK